jgi:hypothetical protein
VTVTARITGGPASMAKVTVVVLDAQHRGSVEA